MTVSRAQEARAATARRPSSFTLKWVMAATGVLFVGFVFVHMIGNLKVYQGPVAFDGYARWLREVGYPLVPRTSVLWGLRVALLVSLVAHVAAGVALWLRGRRARGPHRRRAMRGLTPFAARTMLPGGALILVFVVLHLLDLTVGVGVAPAAYRPAEADGTVHAYANLVASLSRWPMAALYAVTMVVIGVHVFHGWRTVLQDVGATGRRLRAVWVTVGALLAISIAAGNALIPILVQAGVIR